MLKLSVSMLLTFAAVQGERAFFDVMNDFDKTGDCMGLAP